jgi:hypothetical protein
MQEIFEEYGEFVIEAISGILFLGIIAYFFLSTPMASMIQKFTLSILGGSL